MLTFLKKFPLDKLDDEYINTGVFSTGMHHFDGLQITLTFFLAQSEPKRIFIGNFYQENVFKVFSEVDKILPEKHKFNLDYFKKKHEENMALQIELRSRLSSY